jgi:hypothetical protein
MSHVCTIRHCIFKPSVIGLPAATYGDRARANVGWRGEGAAAGARDDR